MSSLFSVLNGRCKLDIEGRQIPPHLNGASDFVSESQKHALMPQIVTSMLLRRPWSILICLNSEVVGSSQKDKEYQLRSGLKISISDPRTLWQLAKQPSHLRLTRYMFRIDSIP